jgi:hypothetical protein
VGNEERTHGRARKFREQLNLRRGASCFSVEVAQSKERGGHPYALQTQYFIGCPNRGASSAPISRGEGNGAAACKTRSAAARSDDRTTRLWIN